MRGFLLGLSLSAPFIIGVFSAEWLVPEAQAKRYDVELPVLSIPRTRWEYTCYRAKLSLNLIEVANKAGEMGWELIVTDGQGDELPVWCFKRPRI